jgi:L-lactate dehydrogenase complex protein LldF
MSRAVCAHVRLRSRQRRHPLSRDATARGDAAADPDRRRRLTGCNFAIAETGTVVVCTNEENADLSANTPPLHIASIGIEKVIPRVKDLGVFLRLLARDALGTPMTQYTSHFRAPRPGAEMHFVLVDNGRSERLGLEEFWTSLKCIRCGACMNTCPVYRRSGGLSYGATYSGPIGLILDPTMNRKRYSSLPFSSTLNGSCTNVCPVKINIHEQIFAWRKVMAEEHRLPLVKAEMMKALGHLLAHPEARTARTARMHQHSVSPVRLERPMAIAFSRCSDLPERNAPAS